MQQQNLRKSQTELTAEDAANQTKQQKKSSRQTIDQNQFRVLLAGQRFWSFFLMVFAIMTVGMMIFLKVLTNVIGYTAELKSHEIAYAVGVTLANVVLLSFLFAFIDSMRRTLLVGVPVQRIILASEKVTKGDFSVRIEKIGTADSSDGFDIIIDYLNQMIEELGSMETLRSDFIANVSHELKTPLSVIGNYCTMLQRDNLTEEERKEYAQAITSTTRNMASMITNILKLNKLENQKIYPSTNFFDLGEQLRESVLVFEELWEKKNLNLHCDIEDDVRINADPELLSLAWNNLLSNAIKFTPSGGDLFVSLKQVDNQAVVRIEDTGSGISEEALERIFEKFYQGDSSHATQGNGLGLALVKRVIDIVGGEIEVESEVGKGSVFSVILPMEKKN